MLKLDKQELSKKENANLIRLEKLEKSIIKKIEKLNKKYEKADRTRLDLNSYLKEIQDKRDAYESHILNTTHKGSFEFIKTQIPKFDDTYLNVDFGILNYNEDEAKYETEQEISNRMEIIKKFASVDAEQKHKYSKRDSGFLDTLAEAVSIVGSDAPFETTKIPDKDESNCINPDAALITGKDAWLHTAHNLGMELSTNECDLHKASKVDLDWKQISDNCNTDGNTKADFDTICNSSITKKQEEISFMEDIYNNVNEHNDIWRNSHYTQFASLIDDFGWSGVEKLYDIKELYNDDMSIGVDDINDNDAIITILDKSNEEFGIINATTRDIPEDKGDICEDIYETVADSVGTGIYWDDDFTKEAKEYVLKNYEELNKNKYDKSVINIKSYDKASDKVLKNKPEKIDLSDINIVG